MLHISRVRRTVILPLKNGNLLVETWNVKVNIFYFSNIYFYSYNDFSEAKLLFRGEFLFLSIELIEFYTF